MGIRLIEIDGFPPFNPLLIQDMGREEDIRTNIGRIGSSRFFAMRSDFPFSRPRIYETIRSPRFATADFDIVMANGEHTIVIQERLPNPWQTMANAMVDEVLPRNRKMAEKRIDELSRQMDDYVGSKEISALYNSLQARILAEYRRIHTQWLEALDAAGGNVLGSLRELGRHPSA